jgi:hypothetical protein
VLVLAAKILVLFFGGAALGGGLSISTQGTPRSGV